MDWLNSDPLHTWMLVILHDNHDSDWLQKHGSVGPNSMSHPPSAIYPIQCQFARIRIGPSCTLVSRDLSCMWYLPSRTQSLQFIQSFCIKSLGQSERQEITQSWVHELALQFSSTIYNSTQRHWTWIKVLWHEQPRSRKLWKHASRGHDCFPHPPSTICSFQNLTTSQWLQQSCGERDRAMYVVHLVHCNPNLTVPGWTCHWESSPLWEWFPKHESKGMHCICIHHLQPNAWKIDLTTWHMHSSGRRGIC